MQINLQDITSRLPVVSIIGNTDRLITRLVSLSNPEITDQDMLWVSEKKIAKVGDVLRGVIICGEDVDRSAIKMNCTYLLVRNPRRYFLDVVKNFFYERDVPEISPHSIIHSSVRLGKNVSIKHGVVIEENCSIGDYTSVDCNTVIKRGTVIGSNVVIGSNNTIGGVGFGYERDEEGNYELIPHIGNVVIQDNVEIGNNTTIDRAVLGSTLISRNAKVDNLVHIAHGVQIGENSLIIANSMIAGSTIIGNNVWVAPSASVLNGSSIGDDAVIGMGAVVLKPVVSGQTVVGNPARDIKSLKK